MPKVTANGVEIAYNDQGSGDTTIVLVHGFPLDKSMWDAQVEALSGEFRVITPDLRGHGESQVVAGPYTMELLADDLKGLLDALNLDKVALGGFSMGGYAVFSFIPEVPGASRVAYASGHEAAARLRRREGRPRGNGTACGE